MLARQADAASERFGQSLASTHGPAASLLDRVVCSRLRLRLHEIEFESSVSIGGRELDLILLLVERGSMVMKTAASDLKVSRSTFSTIADRLEKKGFLVRQPNPDDARSFVLFPTESAKQIFEQFRERIQESIREAGMQDDSTPSPGLMEIFRLLDCMED